MMLASCTTCGLAFVGEYLVCVVYSCKHVKFMHAHYLEDALTCVNYYDEHDLPGPLCVYTTEFTSVTVYRVNVKQSFMHFCTKYLIPAHDHSIHE